MVEVGKKDIHIIGLSIITSNDVAHHELGALWGRFLTSPIEEKLGKLESPDLFAVYSDYENGYQGKYRATIGYAVSDPNNIPEGLSMVTLPAGQYKVYQAKSPAPEDIVAAWQSIWA